MSVSIADVCTYPLVASAVCASESGGKHVRGRQTIERETIKIRRKEEETKRMFACTQYNEYNNDQKKKKKKKKIQNEQ